MRGLIFNEILIFKKSAKSTGSTPNGGRTCEQPAGDEGGGTTAGRIPEVRGTRGSLPEGTSQPDDPGGVGGF